MRLFVLIFPCFAFASSDTDIVPRSINFAIFFALFLYFALSHIKSLHYGRINGISNKLKQLQDDVLEIKNKKDDALSRLAKSKEQAHSMIVNAKNNESVISKTMEEELQKEVLYLQKFYEDKKLHAQKHVKLEVVNKVLSDMFDGIDLSHEELLDIVNRRCSK